MLKSRATASLVALFVVAVLTGVALGQAAETPPQESVFPEDWFYSIPDPDRAKQATRIGKPMPKLNLTEWTNGALPPGQMQGKIVVLQMWMAGSNAFVQSIPIIDEFRALYGGRGVEVIGICTSEGQEKFAQVVKENNVGYPVARDKSRAAEKLFSLKLYPTYVVIDRSGVVRAIGVKSNHLDDLVEYLLTEEAKNAPAAEDRTVNSAWLRGDDEQRARLAPLEGRTPPPLMVDRWINSVPLRLDDLKGKVVLLTFWGGWCSSCQKSFPYINELLEQQQERGLVIIGVADHLTVPSLAVTVKFHKLQYPVAADPTGKTFNAYKVAGVPTYYLIDRAGTLRIADCDGTHLEEAVQALLDEPTSSAGR